MPESTVEIGAYGAEDSILALGRISDKDEDGRRRLVSAAELWIRHLEQVKWVRALQWFENASYLQGNHLTRFYYSADAGLGINTFGINDRSPFDALVARSVDNRLIRPVETVVSMLAAPEPVPRMEPNSDLPEDQDAAAIAEVVVQTFFERPLDMPSRRREAALVAAICGTVAIEVEYGETDYPVIVNETVMGQEVNPFAGEEGEPEKVAVPREQESIAYRKDMIARTWTPFHLTPDPAATSPDDMSWVARASFEDIDWILDAFVKDKPGYFWLDREALRNAMSRENATRHVLYWWSRFQDIIESPQYYHHGGGLAPQTFYTHGGFLANQTLFRVLDVKPSLEYPRGRTLIIAGGQLVYSGPARAWSAKYSWRWHPYAFFSWFKIPGKFWGVPLLTELVPLQKRINAIDALVHANRQYMSIGQWLLPKHSKMAEGRLSGIVGEQFTYTDIPGASRPEKIRNEPLPAELLQERSECATSMDEIAASSLTGSEVSASAARSASILEFLHGERIRSKTPMIQEFEKMVETVGQNILIETQTNLDRNDPELTERIRRAMREYSGFSMESFVGADLRDHHDITIDISSEVLHSPEALEQKAMDVMQYGNLMPHERAGVFKVLRLDRFLKGAENASVRRARRMVSRIVAGNLNALLPMDGIDVAAVMAEVFRSAILDDRFDDYPVEVKSKLVEAFDHYAEIVQKEQAAMMAAQAAQPQGRAQGGQA